MECLTEDDVLAAAAERGGVVRPRQLRRWRKDFVDFTRLRPGRGHGSLTCYPPFAVDQVVAAAATIRPGRDLKVSMILAALECPVPPPGLPAVLLSWRKLPWVVPPEPEEFAYEVEQDIRRRGSPAVPGLSRPELEDALGLTAFRSAGGKADAPSPTTLAALRKLTEHTGREIAERLEIPADMQRDRLAELPSHILEVLPDNLLADIKQAIAGASREELAIAIRDPAVHVVVTRPGRRSAAARAIEVAMATGVLLARRYRPLQGEDLGSWTV